MFWNLAGSKLQIGPAINMPTADTIPFNYVGVTWKDVGEGETFGALPMASSAVEFDALFPAWKRRTKGPRDFGIWEFTYAYDAGDLGQAALVAAEATPSDYVFRLLFPDAPIAPKTGVVTVTIATPGVFTLAAHGLVAGSLVVFSTTGLLPTGIVAGTTYLVSALGLTTNTFSVTAIGSVSLLPTSGTQSGIHTVTSTPQGSQRIFEGKVMSVEDTGGGAEAVMKGKATIAVNARPARVPPTT